MTASLRAKQVSYHIGEKLLLDQVTIGLNPGTLHALVGPNGAGKSTLLRLLAGDIDPTSGDVYLNDRRLRDYSKKDLALLRAVMPQDVVLSLAFTSKEVVMMGRYPHLDGKVGAAWTSKVDAGVTNARASALDHEVIVENMMRATETQLLSDRLYPTLSGGEQARVTLARVMAQETPVLFLDEPTASLDPRHQHLVMRLARRHARQGGTVVVVLHDLNLAAAYADDVVLMSAGQVRVQGPPADVLRSSLLNEVFQANFYVTDHPRLPHPLVLSLPIAE